MKIEPPSLDIPLERKDHLSLWIVAACALVTLLVSFINAGIAMVFAASAIVALPVFFILLFPSRFSFKSSHVSEIGRLWRLAVLFGYIALSKSVLVPFVTRLIERAIF